MRFNLALLVSICVLFILEGCTNPKLNKIKTKQVIFIKNTILYNDPNLISAQIRRECPLNTQIITYMKRYAYSNKIKFVINKKPSKSDKVLKLLIQNAVNSKHKYISLSGQVIVNNKVVSSFKLARQPSARLRKAISGSCALLGSVTKTVGRDIAKWLVFQEDDARLGNTQFINF